MKHAFCIAGASSGVGKTTITIGLLRALKKRGLSPAPFKCGPDYIDPGFHKIACGTASRNLDTWMMGEAEVMNTFNKNTRDFDVAVVEGVMGLFDGAGIGELTGSTAHVAKLLQLPVLLVVNARGIAGTIAPQVKGFVDFKEGVNIAGIIANNVGSEKHADLLAEALNNADLPPLLGFLPRDPQIVMPERHLGLVPTTENKDDFYDILADKVEKYFKIDEILEITRAQMPPPTKGESRKRRPTGRNKIAKQTLGVPREDNQGAGVRGQESNTWATGGGYPTKGGTEPEAITVQKTCSCPTKLAIARDEAFHFYYEDNLDMLREAGIELIPFSPLSDIRLPEGINGIYIGGGFPECFAAELAENTAMKSEIAKFAESGGFIYAECGGLMYLTNGITTNDHVKYPMCGIFPVWTKMENKLRSLGYREARTLEDSPFGPAGTIYRGHEFHWSSAEDYPHPFIEIRNSRESSWKPAGFKCNNVYASYIHAHFASLNTLKSLNVEYVES